MLREKLVEIRAILEASAKAEIVAKVEKLMVKYAKMLDLKSPLPKVVVRNNMAPEWLGQHSYTPSTKEAEMRIQQSIAGDDKTLERVVAHEMIHHAQAEALTPEDLTKFKLGIKPFAHGKDFQALADKINAAMGAGFVTVTSDKEYVTAPNTKEFFVLIYSVGGSLMYSWAARISPKAKPWVLEKLTNGAKLIKTADSQWTNTKAKIERFGSFARPMDQQKQQELERLYKEAPGVQP